MKILAFGPHPDDVEFGCAPILMQEADHGHHVKILVATRGEAASAGTSEQREREARAAANIIGASIDFLDLGTDQGGDCRLRHSPESSILLARQIRMFQPRVVLAPTLDENQHPDHAALARMVQDAARLARYGGLEGLKDLPPHAISHLFFYSITQLFSVPPHLVIDVTAVYDRWVQAIDCHQSQMATRNYRELVTSRARAVGAAIGSGYAIALWTNEPLRVASLADLTLSARYF
jgi:LmbE family N-acetylglucosaminyl deacetylase